MSSEPQVPQKLRSPKSLERQVTGAPWVIEKAAEPIVVNTTAGAPELRWQRRQWHQPVSYGSVRSSYERRRKRIHR